MILSIIFCVLQSNWLLREVRGKCWCLKCLLYTKPNKCSVPLSPRGIVCSPLPTTTLMLNHFCTFHNSEFRTVEDKKAPNNTVLSLLSALDSGQDRTSVSPWWSSLSLIVAASVLPATFFLAALFPLPATISLRFCSGITARRPPS